MLLFGWSPLGRQLPNLPANLPANHRVKLKKKKKKKGKHLDLTRNLKKMWNIKVMVLPIVIGALGTVNKRLLKELEDFEIRG